MATSSAEHIVYLNDGDPLPSPGPDGQMPTILYREWLIPQSQPEFPPKHGMVFEMKAGLPTSEQSIQIGEHGLTRVVEELRH